MATIVNRFYQRQMDLSAVARAALSGFLAGCVAGGIARLSMRVIALAGGQAPSFSFGGTVFILLVFGLVFGTPLAWLYSSIGAWLPARNRPQPYLVSLGVFGLFILLAAFLGRDAEELRLAPPIVIIGAFLPVPLAHALAYNLISERLLSAGIFSRERRVNLPTFLLVLAAIAWDIYALARLVDALRTPPMAVFRALLGAGLSPSAILTLTSVAIYALGVALASVPIIVLWRRYGSPQARMGAAAGLLLLGLLFRVGSRI